MARNTITAILFVSTLILDGIAIAQSSPPNRRRAVQEVGREDRQLGPEIAVTVPLLGPAPFEQTGTSVATDGEDFIVVWTDRRTGDSSARVFGARVTPQRVILDPVGIEIGDGSDASVVWTGTNYVVVWTGIDGRARSRRIGADGSLDVNTRVLTAERGYRLRGPAAWNGKQVAFAERNYNVTRVTAVVFDPNEGGEVFNLSLTNIGTGWYDVGIEIVAVGDAFLLVRLGSFSCPPGMCQAIFSETITATGVVTNARDSGIKLEAQLNGIALASGAAGHYLVASQWTGGKILGYRLDDHGMLVGEATTLDRTFLDRRPRDRAAIAWNGSRFLATWSTPVTSAADDLAFVEIDPDGTVTATRTVGADPWMAQGPAIIWNGSSFLLAWTSGPTWPVADTDVVALSLTPAAPAPAEPFLVSQSSRMQERPVLGSSGAIQLGVWTEFVDGSKRQQLRAGRFTVDGARLDPDGLDVSVPFTGSYYPGRSIHAAVASDRRGFLVVWLQERLLLARRLTGDGVWIDAQPRTLAGTVCSFSSQGVTWNGHEYVAAWSDCSGGVRIRAIASAGEIGDGSATDLISTRESSVPAIAFDGEGYLLAWSQVPDSYGGCQVCTCPASPTEIRSVALSSNLIPIGLPTRTAESGGSPAIAWSGSNYLLAWNDYRGPYALRLTRAGYFADPSESVGVRISSAPVAYLGGLAWNGSAFAMLYHERWPTGDKAVIVSLFRPAESLATQTTLRNRFLIRHSIDSTSSYYSYTPSEAMTAASDGSLVVAYARRSDGAPHGGVSRIFLRRLGVGINSAQYPATALDGRDEELR